MSASSGKNVTLAGGDGQIFEIGGSKTTREMVVETINMADLIGCVESDSCRNKRGTMRVPYFVHLVSIDVEGNEASVLSTWPWDRIMVAIFIVETGADCPDCGNCNKNCQGVRKILRAQGYLKLDMQNPGVDEYYILPHLHYSNITEKEWRIHPPGSHGC